MVKKDYITTIQGTGRKNENMVNVIYKIIKNI